MVLEGHRENKMPIFISENHVRGGSTFRKGNSHEEKKLNIKLKKSSNYLYFLIINYDENFKI